MTTGEVSAQVVLAECAMLLNVYSTKKDQPHSMAEHHVLQEVICFLEELFHLANRTVLSGNRFLTMDGKDAEYLARLMRVNKEKMYESC
jgi:hypothetical protein